MNPPPETAPPQRNCLRIGMVGCVSLLVLVAVLVAVLILLAKFIWGLRLDQWL